MNARKLIAVLLVSVFGLASTASAYVISYDTNFGPTAVGSPTTTLYLSQFDPALGTLNSVTLTLDATASAGSIAWDNEADQPSTVTLGIGAEVTAIAPDALALVAVPLQTDSGSVDADNDGDADFIGTDAFSVTGGTGNDSDSAALPPGDLTPYIGTGDIAVSVVGLAETYLSTSGGFGPIDPTPGDFSGTVTVEYNYIPEPATLSILTLAGLALIRRRRK